jgi:hypothetical protein
VQGLWPGWPEQKNRRQKDAQNAERRTQRLNQTNAARLQDSPPRSKASLNPKDYCKPSMKITNANFEKGAIKCRSKNKEIRHMEQRRALMPKLFENSMLRPYWGAILGSGL